MPELVHSCGKKLTFPDGSEGRRGKCPSCGQAVEVPRAPAPPPAAEPMRGGPKAELRTGLAPRPRPSSLEKIVLDPPPNWETYQAYLDGKGPAPRSFVMPAQVMLATDAEEVWKRAEALGPPSKYK